MALGIQGTDEPFPCVVPDHDHSAELYRRSEGTAYRCAEATGSLAEVRAWIAYGGVRRIGDVEVSRWAERLDHEAGLREWRPVHVPVPEEASAAVERVAHGLALLLGLREQAIWNGESVVFAREFASAWCGVSERTARDAIRWLEKAAVIERLGKSGRAITWRVRGIDTEREPARRKDDSDEARTERLLADHADLAEQAA